MIHIVFKNLERSELAKEAVQERIATIVEKFPDLQDSKVVVTLEMENSPHKRGPDLFTVKLHVPDGRYRGVTVSKSASNLYEALAEIVDHMLEKLNRFGHRNRVKGRAVQRKLVNQNMSATNARQLRATQ
jgi:ribosome-associated translation inhibitor RaiA